MTWFIIAYISVVFLELVYFLLFTRLSKPLNKGYFIFLLVLNILIITFRPAESPDTYQYIQLYNDSSRIMENINGFSLFSKYGNQAGTVEVGYLALCFAFKSIGLHYRFLFFCISTFTILVTPKALNHLFFDNDKESYRIVSVAYMATYGILYSCIVVRSGLALALGLLSLSLLKKKNYVLAPIILFVGFLIHRTIILFVPIDICYLIFKNKTSGNLKWTIPIFVIEILMVFVYLFIYKFSINPLIEKVLKLLHLDNYMSYANTKVRYPLGATKTAICLVLFSCIFLSYFDKKENGFLIIIMLIVPVIIVLSANFRAASRMYDYFLIFIIPLSIQYKLDNGDSEIARSPYDKGSMLSFLTIVMFSIICLNTVFTFTA